MTASVLRVYVITAALWAAKPQPPHSQPPPIEVPLGTLLLRLRARAVPAISSHNQSTFRHEFFDIPTEQYGMGPPQTPSPQET